MPKIIIVQYEEDPDAITKFKMCSRYLWDDHISFTRNAIISVFENLDDINAIADRLSKNQDDIAAVIVPYYGQVAADKLAGLLKSHISLATDFIRYTKAGINTVDTSTKVSDNITEIATLLSTLDPEYWPKDTVISLFKDHVACLIKAVDAQAKRDWVAGIAAYDEGHMKISALSDAFSEGIICKFPEKFVKYDRFPIF